MRSARAVSAEAPLVDALQSQGEMRATKRQSVERDVENPGVSLLRHARVCAARSRASAACPRDSSRSQYRYPGSEYSKGYSGCRSLCRRSASANRSVGLFPFARGVERIGLGRAVDHHLKRIRRRDPQARPRFSPSPQRAAIWPTRSSASLRLDAWIAALLQSCCCCAICEAVARIAGSASWRRPLRAQPEAGLVKNPRARPAASSAAAGVS